VRAGMSKAKVALARTPAVIMHRIAPDGQTSPHRQGLTHSLAARHRRTPFFLGASPH